MKTALLIPVSNIHTGGSTWIWETPSECDLSPEYPTRAEVLAHRPDPTAYVCRDDGYNRI